MEGVSAGATVTVSISFLVLLSIWALCSVEALMVMLFEK